MIEQLKRWCIEVSKELCSETVDTAGTICDEVTIVDYAGTFDSNALTVAANGSEKIFGSTDDLTVSTERAAFTLVFTDSTQGWLFKND